MVAVRICLIVLYSAIVSFGQAGASRDNRQGPARLGFIELRLLTSDSPTATGDANGSVRSGEEREFRLLATNKTSTMQKEMNDAADAGYRFEGTMGGDTSFGGSEVVVIMSQKSRGTEEALRVQASRH